MIVRRAAKDDIPRLVELGLLFHAKSPYSVMTYDPERVALTLESALESGVVVVHGHPIDGMAAAIKGPMWFADAYAAQEVFLWGRGGKEMREALEEWAREQGCETFSMVCLENDRMPTVARMYRMAGYRPTEHHFVKAL